MMLIIKAYQDIALLHPHGEDSCDCKILRVNTPTSWSHFQYNRLHPGILVQYLLHKKTHRVQWHLQKSVHICCTVMVYNCTTVSISMCYVHKIYEVNLLYFTCCNKSRYGNETMLEGSEDKIGFRKQVNGPMTYQTGFMVVPASEGTIENSSLIHQSLDCFCSAQIAIILHLP